LENRAAGDRRACFGLLSVIAGKFDGLSPGQARQRHGGSGETMLCFGRRMETL
jgi:hypothetical protein